MQKTARVGEEVVVHTDATEREEAVRDTVRRQEVEITREGDKVGAEGGDLPGGTAGAPRQPTTP